MSPLAILITRSESLGLQTTASSALPSPIRSWTTTKSWRALLASSTAEAGSVKSETWKRLSCRSSAPTLPSPLRASRTSALDSSDFSLSETDESSCLRALSSSRTGLASRSIRSSASATFETFTSSGSGRSPLRSTCSGPLSTVTSSSLTVASSSR